MHIVLVIATQSISPPNVQQSTSLLYKIKNYKCRNTLPKALKTKGLYMNILNHYPKTREKQLPKQKWRGRGAEGG